MTAWKPHPLLSATYFLLLVVCAQSSALARGGGLPHDEPWNPEHIDSLPQEVRNSVLHMCRVRPNAAHYFATYLDCGRVIKLHFEHFDCEGRQMYRKGTFACMRSLCCQVRSIGKRETTTVDVTIEPARNAATLEYLPSLRGANAQSRCDRRDCQARVYRQRHLKDSADAHRWLRFSHLLSPLRQGTRGTSSGRAVRGRSACVRTIQAELVCGGMTATG